MRSFLKLSTFASVLCLSLSVFAETAPMNPAMSPAISAARPGTLLADNTINRHFGFFIRPDLGFGYLSSSESSGLGDATISGVAGVAGLSIGGAVAENLILGAHIFDAVTSNPNVSLGNASSNTSNASLTMFGVGPELTYYFMPNNIYLSGTVALTRMTFNSNGNDASTDWGFGSRVTLGKEWWVSNHWGLGLSGHISYSANNDPASNGNGNLMSSWAVGAAFSATYN
jgi:hypothetical protein